MASERQTVTQERLQTASSDVKKLTSKVNSLRTTLGTAVGPAFYNLDRVKPENLLSVGASLATELTVLQEASTITLPEVGQRLDKAMAPSPEFAAIQSAYQSGAMPEAIYNKLQSAFISQNSELLVGLLVDSPKVSTSQQPSKDLPSEPAEQVIETLQPSQAIVTSTVETKAGKVEAAEVHLFIAPDGTEVKGRYGQFLNILGEARDDEGKQLPVIRATSIALIFGSGQEQAENGQKRISQAVQKLNEIGSLHQFRIETTRGRNEKNLPVAMDKLVLSEPQIDGSVVGTESRSEPEQAPASTADSISATPLVAPTIETKTEIGDVSEASKKHEFTAPDGTIFTGQSAQLLKYLADQTGPVERPTAAREALGLKDRKGVEAMSRIIRQLTKNGLKHGIELESKIPTPVERSQGAVSVDRLILNWPSDEYHAAASRETSAPEKLLPAEELVAVGSEDIPSPAIRTESPLIEKESPLEDLPLAQLSEFSDVYKAPDGHKFTGKFAQFLSVMDDSSAQFPFRRDRITQIIHGNTSRPYTSFSVMLSTFGKQLDEHEISLHSVGANGRSASHLWIEKTEASSIGVSTKAVIVEQPAAKSEPQIAAVVEAPTTPAAIADVLLPAELPAVTPDVSSGSIAFAQEAPVAEVPAPQAPDLQEQREVVTDSKVMRPEHIGLVFDTLRGLSAEEMLRYELPLNPGEVNELTFGLKEAANLSPEERALRLQEVRDFAVQIADNEKRIDLLTANDGNEDAQMAMMYLMPGANMTDRTALFQDPTPEVA